jgi:hypothetical protein
MHRLLAALALVTLAACAGCATARPLPFIRMASQPSGMFSELNRITATVGDFVTPPRRFVASGVGLVLGLGGTGDHRAIKPLDNRPVNPKDQIDSYTPALELATELHAEIDAGSDPWDDQIKLEDVGEYDIARVRVEVSIPPGAPLSDNLDVRLIPIGNAEDLDGGRLIRVNLTLDGSRIPIVLARGTIQTSLDPATNNYVWQIPGGGDLLSHPDPVTATLDCRGLPRNWRIAILSYINDAYPGSVIDTAARLKDVNLDKLATRPSKDGAKPIEGDEGVGTADGAGENAGTDRFGGAPPTTGGLDIVVPDAATLERAEGEVAESDIKRLQAVIDYFKTRELGTGKTDTNALKVDIPEIVVRLTRKDAPPITLADVLAIKVTVTASTIFTPVIIADRRAKRFGIVGVERAQFGDSASVVVWSTGTGDDRKYDTFEFDRPFFSSSAGEPGGADAPLPDAVSAIAGSQHRQWVDKVSLRPPDIDYVDIWRARNNDNRIRRWLIGELGAMRMKQLVITERITVTQPPGPKGGPVPPKVVGVSADSEGREYLVPCRVLDFCEVLAADGMTFAQIETVLRDAAQAGAMSACVIEGALPALPKPEPR